MEAIDDPELVERIKAVGRRVNGMAVAFTVLMTVAVALCSA
ncbi:MAG: hypothetical protein QNJ90_03925 [Planctomycetota bacterium]|nr:hypothetical protein [Planctomycetota bacterium]